MPLLGENIPRDQFVQFLIGQIQSRVFEALSSFLSALSKIYGLDARAGSVAQPNFGENSVSETWLSVG